MLRRIAPLNGWLVLAIACGGEPATESKSPERFEAVRGAGVNVALNVEAYSQALVASWRDTPAENYVLQWSLNATCAAARYEGCADTRRQLGVRSPYEIRGLKNGTRYHIALFATRANGTTSLTSASARPGALDVDGPVYATAVDDNGTVYLGGNFRHVSKALGGAIAVVGPKGRLSSNAPAVDGTVSVVRPDRSGGWFLGGQFFSVGQAGRRNIAHIDSLGRVSAWAPNIGEFGGLGWVSDIAVGNDAVYVAGGFGSRDRYGVASVQVAAFDRNTGAALWSISVDHERALRSAVRISTLAWDGEHLYVGGFFTHVANRRRPGLAAFDRHGRLTSWLPELNVLSKQAIVRQLAAGLDMVFVRWRVPTEAGQVKDEVAAVARDGAVRWQQTFEIRESVSTGADSRHWAPPPTNTMVVAHDRIYVAGRFSHVGASPHPHLVALSPSGAVTDFRPRLLPPAADSSASDRYGGSSGIKAVAADETTLYALGAFTAAADQPRPGAAAWNKEGILQAWAPDLISDGLSAQGGVVYAFATPQLNGTPRKRLAAFNAAGTLLPWAPDLTAVSGSWLNVSGVAAHDDIIYVGGTFSAVNGQPRAGLAAIRSDGNVTPWRPALDRNDPGRIAVFGGNLYVIDQPLEAVSLVDGSAVALPSVFGPDTWVSSVMVHEGVIYAGISRRLSTYEYVDELVAVDEASGTLLWAAAADGSINSIVVQDGRLYAAGTFTRIADRPAPALAVLRLDGTLDATVGPDEAAFATPFEWLGTSDHALLAARTTWTGDQSFYRFSRVGPWGEPQSLAFSVRGDAPTLAYRHGVLYLGASQQSPLSIGGSLARRFLRVTLDGELLP